MLDGAVTQPSGRERDWGACVEVSSPANTEGNIALLLHTHPPKPVGFSVLEPG